MTLAISHKEFSPEATVEEFARLLRAYRCTSVYGDRYAGAA
jgi:hypothetical protein